MPPRIKSIINKFQAIAITNYLVTVFKMADTLIQFHLARIFFASKPQTIVWKENNEVVAPILPFMRNCTFWRDDVENIMRKVYYHEKILHMLRRILKPIPRWLYYLLFCILNVAYLWYLYWLFLCLILWPAPVGKKFLGKIIKNAIKCSFQPSETKIHKKTISEVFDSYHLSQYQFLSIKFFFKM